MAAKNKGSNNLQALLEADGYNSADADQVAIPPHMSELSRPMLRRVRALKKVQLESLEVEAKFYQKVHELEKEFQPLFDAIGVKRRAIVTGEHEPEESEVELPLVYGVTPEELEKIENEAPVEGGEPSKGIPNFWYNTLQSVGNISDWIKENDEPVLKYLMDITTEVHDDPAGFTLNFHFAENPYFANQVLTKRYELDLEIDLEEPFEYDGPTVKKGEGCEIQWKEGKNVTQKTIKKKLKKGPQAGKYITKTVPNESFFTYFDPTAKTLEREMEPEEEERVREDFEIGQMLRDQVIPRAVLFYTGEAAEEDYDDFDDEEGDEDDEGNHSAGSEDEEE